PDAESRLTIELFVERFPFFRRHLQRLAQIRLVQETPMRLPAPFEDLWIAGFDLELGLRVDRPIEQRRAIVRRALEDGQMAGGLRHFLDHLNSGGSGPDDGYSLPREGHGMM